MLYSILVNLIFSLLKFFLFSSMLVLFFHLNNLANFLKLWTTFYFFYYYYLLMGETVFLLSRWSYSFFMWWSTCICSFSRLWTLSVSEKCFLKTSLILLGEKGVRSSFFCLKVYSLQASAEMRLEMKSEEEQETLVPYKVTWQLQKAG